MDTNRRARLHLPRELMPAPNLVTAALTLAARITTASNSHLPGCINDAAVVNKPIAGEKPLWDLPDGCLAHREVAAYLVSEVLGWPLPQVVNSTADNRGPPRSAPRRCPGLHQGYAPREVPFSCRGSDEGDLHLLHTEALQQSSRGPRVIKFPFMEYHLTSDDHGGGPTCQV